MIRAAELLQVARAYGAAAYFRGDTVFLRPRSALPPELVGALRSCKADVLAELRREAEREAVH